MSAPSNLSELRQLRAELDNLRDRVDSAVARASESRQEDLTGAAMDKLERRVAELESARDEMVRRVVEVEQDNGRLMNLYIAAYHLHATLDPEEVQAAIAEIAVNLLGVEQFALLLRSEEGEKIAVSHGVDGLELFAEGRYRGGSAAIDAALSEGVVRIEVGHSPVAVVPLKVSEGIVGALVLMKLFDHKAAFQNDDQELLDMLAAHAASALLASRAYASTTRKLRTLEGLVNLVRGN